SRPCSEQRGQTPFGVRPQEVRRRDRPGGRGTATNGARPRAGKRERCEWAGRRASGAPANSVAPVEVAGAIDGPEAGIFDRSACGYCRSRGLDGLFTGPRQDVLGAVRDEVRLDAVHRLLETGLLFSLEQRVVLERIVRPV